ncbi:MAG: hypothetical protein DRR11_02555 [Gammaproteobacteria bacterium]|nr:MAG: hypothetical protein DRR11_02555 [Gammaproteobacteria bacterium]
MSNSKRTLTCLLIAISLLIASINGLYASGNRTYQCNTSEEVYKALKAVVPGDTIMLQGGREYEIDKSFELFTNGTENSRIRFTSQDGTGQGRYAVITTVGQKKEEDLVALKLHGSFWSVSKLEIAGTRVPLTEGYWDTNGFRIGLFLNGSGAHDNVIEDIHIHHTHNTAVAIRDQSHDNVFRRMKIHHIGEWLSEDYNAHEGEGFYIGSSKGFDEEENRAVVHDILIEDSVLGPGLLGQYIDLKYAASSVTVRNNVLFCDEKSYNEEIVKLAGYANTITANKFVGSAANLTRYIHIFNKKTRVPVKVDYLGQEDIPAPTGLDNTIVDNVFYTDDPEMLIIKNDLVEADQSSLVFDNNEIRPLDEYTEF